jgi:DNA-binding NarL/FixJ family response regulator
VSDNPEVALVSGDLILASRLSSALAGLATLRMVDGSGLPTATTVFVDLNDDADARIELISALRSRGAARLIAFCQHDERELRIRAMAQGADQVVTNGALAQAALRLVGAGTGG